MIFIFLLSTLNKLIAIIKPQQPEIKSKLSKSLHNTIKTYKNFCSSTIFNMCYATPAQPEIITDSHSMLHSLNLISVKLVEKDFRGLHLRNLNPLLTISFYSTLAQPESHYLHTNWFQRSTPAQTENFADNIIVHYTRTTWFSLHW